MKKLLIALVVVVAITGGIVGVLLLNLNSLIKTGVETAGTRALGVPVTVRDVSVSLFNGQGRISGLRVANPEGYEGPYAIAIAGLSIDLEPRSLSSDTIVIRQILIDGAEIWYEGNLVDSNIQALQRAAASGDESAPADSESGTARVEIDHLTIRDTRVGVHVSMLKEPLSLVLPLVEINGIGKDEPATASETILRVLKAVNQSLVPLIRESLPGVEDKLKEVGDKIGEKLKGLFNR
ncbi:MAG: hypothetical protein O2780_01830 [Proteobacteria bacterium]|jgi:hypothetical protein|nr:hypothetical protein [Pseudomonadota bacterium]MDA1299205.1 hypothetical protein [Pseudomonadota bacterium]